MLLFMMSLFGFAIEIYFSNVDGSFCWMSGALCLSSSEEFVSFRT
jgi:hypothetical protein